MFGSLKIAIVLMVLAAAGGGFVYVKGLQADLAVSEANNQKLLDIKDEQDAVIEQMKKDFAAINKAKAELETALANAEKDNKELASKFAKYDIALWGMEDPVATAKTITSHILCSPVASITTTAGGSASGIVLEDGTEVSLPT